MEPASISALAALGGATVGGVASFAATWVTQRTQARIRELSHKRTRREELYKHFIEEASRLYVDALAHEMSDFSKLVGLYAMINMMRVMSSRSTLESAEKVGRMIVNTYLEPNKTVPELHDMVNRAGVDVLQIFGEAARQEFRGLGL